MSGLVITGKEGVISIDAVEVDVVSFAITTSGATLEATDGSDAAAGWRNKLPGKFKQWSGTAEIILKVAIDDYDIVNTSAAFIGTAETTQGTVTYTGAINITEVVDNIPVEAEEVAKVTINFDGLSTLTKANAV